MANYIPKSLLSNSEVAEHNKNIELLIRDTEFESRGKRACARKVTEFEAKLGDTRNKVKNLQTLLKTSSGTLGETTQMVLQAELEGEKAKLETMESYLLPEIKKLSEQKANHQQAIADIRKEINKEEKKLEAYIRTA